MRPFRSLLAGCAAGALALLTLACGDGGSTAPAGPALAVDGDTARVGGILPLVVRGGTVDGALAVTVGGVAAGVTATSDTTLLVLVPEVAAGRQPVQVTMGARTLATQATIAAGLAIADPAAAVTQAVDAAATLAEADRPADMSDAEWGAMQRQLDSLRDDVRARLAAATPEERLAAARLLASLGLDAEPTAALARRAAAIATPAAPRTTVVVSADCALAAGKALAHSVVAVTAAAAVVLSPWAGAAGLIVAPVGIAALRKAMPLARAAWPKAAAACYIQDQVSLVDQLLGTSSMVALGASRGALLVDGWRFTEGAPLTKYAAGNFRSLREADADATWTRGIAVIDELIAALDRLPSAIRDFLGAAPAPLATLLGQPDQQRAVSPALVRIENVSPSTVTLTAAASGEALLLTARGAADVDTPFSFEVVSMQDATIRRRYDAVLAAAQYQVVWPDGSALADPVSFTDGQSYSFRLVQQGNAGAAIDYAQVQVTGNSNAAVTIARTNDASSFSLRLTSGTANATTSFTVTYKGRAVATIHATVASACEIGALLGTWTATQGFGVTTPGSTANGSWNSFPVWVYGSNFNAMALDASLTIHADTSYTAVISWYQTAPDGTGRYGPGGNPISGVVTTTYVGRMQLYCNAGSFEIGTVDGVGTMTGTESNFDAPSFSSTVGTPYVWSFSPASRQLEWSAAFSPGIFLGGRFRAVR